MTQKDITFVADFLTEHFNEVSYIGVLSTAVVVNNYIFAAGNWIWKNLNTSVIFLYPTYYLCI